MLFAAVPHSAPVFFAGRIPTCNSEDPLLYFDLLEGGFDKLSRKNESQIEILDGAGHILMLEESYYKHFQDKVVHVDFMR